MVVKDALEAARVAADIIARIVRDKPTAALLVATGNTPLPAYAELARRAENGEVDFSRVLAVQLDEYVGLEEDDPRSLWRWTRRSFVDPLGVTRTLRLVDVTTFDDDIAKVGGLDLAVLGLGPNGHLGFNEPPCDEHAKTREVDLTPESLVSNARYFDLPVPTRARTAGMTTILSAREKLLIVTGAHKRRILARTLDEVSSRDVPASWLRGEDTTVVADEEARPRD
ncbi:glucosamine-6-phosphate deaminase [Deinococcus yavapaiensis KR-236]|uniref:Glucosamine-6-phosphate deaminase n=1 Tax=Deinococcus yavapaiensis KR-236 TaxID=694435 RepID=A0A318SFI8_9DEIO|nr:glucosamine-6-phosphate deaminase [Deinococcus yavapaiensis KR-236]